MFFNLLTKIIKIFLKIYFNIFSIKKNLPLKNLLTGHYLIDKASMLDAIWWGWLDIKINKI
jgi:hypothetical protein